MPIVNTDAKSLDVDKVSWHGKTLRTRLLSKLKIVGDCWIWTGAKRSNNKCGAIKIRANYTISTHRLSYLIHIGEIPDGMNVLHTCDNPLCCNPQHLFLGTQLENIKDRDEKGRQRNRFSIQQLGPAAGREGG